MIIISRFLYFPENKNFKFSKYTWMALETNPTIGIVFAGELFIYIYIIQ